tara:strand:- start:6068 stop:6475 length:408 start_codon:yes stop_codon:yes gene_type:complete
MIFKNMTLQTILVLVLIGIASGILSGFVGVGGGIIIVPAFIFLLGMNQLNAQGTSLFVLLLPIGILAVMNYWKAGQINWIYGLIVSLAFVAGGYFGSKLALRISPNLVRLIFGIIMVFISFKLLYSGYQGLSNEK